MLRLTSASNLLSASFAKNFAPFAVKTIILTFSTLLLLFQAQKIFSQSSTPLLSCAVKGPDSVLFDKLNYNQYIKGTFPVFVSVTNTGPTIADSVVVFVRSNQRFNIIPPASRRIADTLFINDTLHTQFSLTINPKDTSGYDTVTIAVSGKSGVRTECTWLIWVEKQYKPLNAILCPPDSSIGIVFSDSLNEYTPNPIIVPITVINIGDAPSKETKIIYVATPGVAPAEGEFPIYEIGTRPPNFPPVQKDFRLKILRRTTDTTVDLRFKVQGKGGIGDRIIDTVCSYRLYIPASRDVVFQLDCKNGLQIKFENGSYSPNPFAWKVTVKNVGNGIARNVQAAIALPSSVQLDSTLTSKIVLGDMSVGEERIITWMLRVKPTYFPDTGEVCVYVFDEFNRHAQCCDTLILPAMKKGILAARCTIIPDSIFIDKQSGEFQPKDFTARLELINAGDEDIDSIVTEIILNDASVVPVQTNQQLILRLASRQTTQVDWKLIPLTNPTARDVTIRFSARAKKGDLISTACTVYVAASLQPLLQCSSGTAPSDTLHFNSSSLEYDSLLFRAACKNVGTLAAKDVQATIILPPGLSLAANESAVKTISSGVLLQDSIWQLVWKLQPVKNREGVLYTIRVEFKSGSVKTACEDWVFVIGIPPITVLSMPRNLVERFGNTVTVPVQIDDPQNKDINRMILVIEYDASKVEYLDYDLHGSEIGSNWSITPTIRRGRLGYEITSTKISSGNYASLQSPGTLMNLVFKVVFGDGEDQLKISGTELHFDSIANSVNKGAITTRYFDGYITVSGKCIYPMDATDKYVVLQAKPNPFGTSTVIEYVVPERGHITLVMYDLLGRKVETIVDDIYDAGRYSTRWNVSKMNAGIYFCILHQDKKNSIIKLIVKH